MKERVTSTMKEDPKQNDKFHSVFEREKVSTLHYVCIHLPTEMDIGSG